MGAALFLICLAASAVLIVALNHLSLWLGNRESQNEEEQDRYRDQEQRDRNNKLYQSATDAVVARLETVSDELYSQRKQQRRQDRKNTFLEILGLSAAAAAAVFAFCSAWIVSAHPRLGRARLGGLKIA